MDPVSVWATRERVAAVDVIAKSNATRSTCSIRSTLRRKCMGFRREGAGPTIRWLRALSLTCRPLAALRGGTWAINQSRAACATTRSRVEILGNALAAHIIGKQ